MNKQALVDRFQAVFNGRQNMRGVRLNNGANLTKTDTGADFKDYENHLKGVAGLGLNPLLLSNQVNFVVADFDNKKAGVQTAPELDIQSFAYTFKEDGGLAFRSKSGGVHLYFFFESPVKGPLACGYVRNLIQAYNYTADLDAIFPKQSSLTPEATGNWVNLPYFAYVSTTYKADRCLYIAGRGFIENLEEALEIIEKSKIDPSKVEQEAIKLSNQPRVRPEEHLPIKGVLSHLQAPPIQSQVKGVDFIIETLRGAPPCIVSIAKLKAKEGGRNNFAYQLAVFLKKKYPEDFLSRLYELNKAVMETPLNDAELMATFGSINKKAYQYRCKDEPCALYCDKTACEQLEFGILTKAKRLRNKVLQGLGFADVLVYKVRKYEATPIIWEVFFAENNASLPLNERRRAVIECTSKELVSLDTVSSKLLDKNHLLNIGEVNSATSKLWQEYIKERVRSLTSVKRLTEGSLDSERVDSFVFERFSEIINFSNIGSREEQLLTFVRDQEPTLILHYNSSLPLILFKTERLQNDFKSQFSKDKAEVERFPFLLKKQFKVNRYLIFVADKATKRLGLRLVEKETKRNIRKLDGLEVSGFFLTGALLQLFEQKRLADSKIVDGLALEREEQKQRFFDGRVEQPPDLIEEPRYWYDEDEEDILK